MDVLTLSRIQFAATAMFHFLFVPLTLGLSWLLAWWEIRYVRTGDERYLRMTRFWGRLFLINFALGVVTGITMEFQFGMNWAEYSRYVGDIFGAPLAIEATAAFFLESVFIGLWVFGWNRVSKTVHALAMVIIAFAASLSALWIMLANGWMQHPVGYALRNGRAEMTDFGALVSNGYALTALFHTLLSGFVCAGFFVMGVSAFHIRRRNQTEVFQASFRTAAAFALAAAVLVAVTGDRSGIMAARYQPAKLAAMESQWETQAGAPFAILAWPDARNERNHFEFLKIPELLSFMAYHHGEARVLGLKDIPPGERPPVWPVFLCFRLMIACGALFLLLAFLGWWKVRRNALEAGPLFLRVLTWAIPLPYLAIQFGWLVAELGRQPWIVYGLMKTTDGVSRAVAPAQALTSLIGFVVLYGALAVLDISLLWRTARRGPVDAPAEK